MPLPDRSRAHLRRAIEAAFQAEDAVAAAADEAARAGYTDADAALDAAAQHVKNLIAQLEPLLGASPRRRGA